MADERYARQVMLPEIGEEGQRRLASSSVLLVGLGGLGSAVAPILAGAGVGRIGLCDHDTVSWSNLPRPTPYTEEEVGRPKCEAALPRLAALSSATRLGCHTPGRPPATNPSLFSPPPSNPWPKSPPEPMAIFDWLTL